MSDCKQFIAHVRSSLGPGADKDERAVFSPKFVIKMVETLEQYDAEILRLESRLDLVEKMADQFHAKTVAEFEHKLDALDEMYELSRAEAKDKTARLEAALSRLDAAREALIRVELAGTHKADPQVRAAAYHDLLAALGVTEPVVEKRAPVKPADFDTSGGEWNE